MHEYGWSLQYCLWELPLAQAYALYAAIDARYGNEPKGPTYADQEVIRALRTAAT